MARGLLFSEDVQARLLLVVLAAVGCGPNDPGAPDEFELENRGEPRRFLLNGDRPAVLGNLACEHPGCELTLTVFAWLEDPRREEQARAPGLNLVYLDFTAPEGTSKDWLLRRTTNVPDPRAMLRAPKLPPGPATLLLRKSDADALGVEISASWGPADAVDDPGPPPIEWSDEGIEQ